MPCDIPSTLISSFLPVTNTPEPMNAPTATSKGDFVFPKSYNYPPLFCRQPVLQTQQAQLHRWSILIQKYCRHNRIYQLSIIDALETPLFHNTALKKRLSLNDVKEVIEYMVSKEADERAEWSSPEKVSAWIWWRKPEEWANMITAWVDDTGQKGVVLTLYELVEGEATVNQEFHGLDRNVLQRSLNTLVKRGKAQVFGTEEQQGAKFF
jgi:ESCRT-II complex subunit VPS25